MPQHTRKSNTDGRTNARSLFAALSKQIPHAAGALVAIMAVGAPAPRASFAAAAAATMSSSASATLATRPWTDKIKDALRRAHNRLHNYSYSLADPITVDAALNTVMEDYLAYGFNPNLTAAERLETQADIIEIYCLLMAPEDESDPTTMYAFLALCPVMIEEVGGSAQDLDCD